MNSFFRFFRAVAGRTAIPSKSQSPAVDRRKRANLAYLQFYRPQLEDAAGPDFSGMTVPEIRRVLLKASDESWPELVQILRGLASVNDCRGMYTQGHSERVTRFSGEIAKIIGLPEDDVEKIRIGGLIHDIGKIMIDKDILNKPAPLTRDEYEVMKTHPRLGYELLKDIPRLKEIVPGLLFHHERLNGRGYPYGLAGDEIPMIARVITVADCFDAATTIRPYQEDPAPAERMLALIRSAAGIKYDKTVVEALARGIRTGRIVTRLEDRTPVRREA